MDQSPTALFDSYEQDLQQILGSVREKLDGEAKEGRGGVFTSFFCVNAFTT